MKISSKVFRHIKNIPNSVYDKLKVEFLFHSNKIEGSTFSKENLIAYIDSNMIEGSHKKDDVMETMNSVDLFDFLIETLDEPLSKRLILEFHSILKQNTRDEMMKLSGTWKKFPNEISGTGLKLSSTVDVEFNIAELIEYWNDSDKSFESIIEFHARFELIHPFQDGNGRIGRFLMLKQCIENEVDLIAIDEEFEKEYKGNLYSAQTTKDFTELLGTFRKCQQRLDTKLELYSEMIKKLEVELD